ncbi:MAG: winged helix-turn-helix domain-containing protein [Candidatus Bathyarchaeia archaeon]
MKIEEVFSSKLRMKILRMLAEVGELNVSEITRRLGANYETTSSHLKVLEEEQLVKQKTFGRIRLYRLNEQSPRTRALKILLESWEKEC